MKTQIRSLLTLVCAAAASLLITGSPAQAGYIVTLEQVGPDVVATGSGAIDLTDLTLQFHGFELSRVFPIKGIIVTGPTRFTSTDIYINLATGPRNFGSGGFGRFANSGSGDLVGIFGIEGEVFVPHGYVSGTALSDSATYNNATFSSLGITP